MNDINVSDTCMVENNAGSVVCFRLDSDATGGGGRDGDGSLCVPSELDIPDTVDCFSPRQNSSQNITLRNVVISSLHQKCRANSPSRSSQSRRRSSSQHIPPASIQELLKEEELSRKEESISQFSLFGLNSSNQNIGQLLEKPNVYNKEIVWGGELSACLSTVFKVASDHSRSSDASNSCSNNSHVTTGTKSSVESATTRNVLSETREANVRERRQEETKLMEEEFDAIEDTSRHFEETDHGEEFCIEEALFVYSCSNTTLTMPRYDDLDEYKLLPSTTVSTEKCLGSEFPITQEKKDSTVSKQEFPTEALASLDQHIGQTGMLAANNTQSIPSVAHEGSQVEAVKRSVRFDDVISTDGYQSNDARSRSHSPVMLSCLKRTSNYPFGTSTIPSLSAPESPVQSGRSKKLSLGKPPTSPSSRKKQLCCPGSPGLEQSPKQHLKHQRRNSSPIRRSINGKDDKRIDEIARKVREALADEATAKLSSRSTSSKCTGSTAGSTKRTSRRLSKSTLNVKQESPSSLYDSSHTLPPTSSKNRLRRSSASQRTTARTNSSPSQRSSARVNSSPSQRSSARANSSPSHRSSARANSSLSPRRMCRTSSSTKMKDCQTCERKSKNSSSVKTENSASPRHHRLVIKQIKCDESLESTSIGHDFVGHDSRSSSCSNIGSPRKNSCKATCALPFLPPFAEDGVAH